MQSLIDALVRQGYAVVFGWVLAEQIGLPLPAEPFLLASGGVAGTDRLSLPLILVAASVASLLADAIYIKDTGPARLLTSSAPRSSSDSDSPTIRTAMKRL